MGSMVVTRLGREAVRSLQSWPAMPDAHAACDVSGSLRLVIWGAQRSSCGHLGYLGPLLLPQSHEISFFGLGRPEFQRH